MAGSKSRQYDRHAKNWLDSPQYKRWLRLRRMVFRAKGTTCALCRRAKAVKVHHLIEHHEGGSDDLDNLIPVCDPCHKAEHRRRTDVMTPERRAAWRELGNHLNFLRSQP